MLYSRASELAIRAALFLALQPPGKLSPVREVARRTRLPQPYLAKIIRQLSVAGLVRAFRGPGGGIELGRAPAAITLWAIVRAMDGPAFERCVLNPHDCSDQGQCPLHQQWKPLQESMRRLLEETTLAALVAGRPSLARTERAEPATRGGSAEPRRRPAMHVRRSA